MCSYKLVYVDHKQRGYDVYFWDTVHSKTIERIESKIERQIVFRVLSLSNVRRSQQWTRQETLHIISSKSYLDKIK